MQGAVSVQTDAGVALHAQCGPILLPDVPESKKDRYVKRGREGRVGGLLGWAQPRAGLEQGAPKVGRGQAPSRSGGTCSPLRLRVGPLVQERDHINIHRSHLQFRARSQPGCFWPEAITKRCRVDKRYLPKRLKD